MRRLLTILGMLGLGLVITASLALPAAAETDRAKPADRADRVPDADKPDLRPDAQRPDVRPEIERLHLECSGRISDAGRAAIACSWRPATNVDAAGYVLVRTHGDNETVVFRTDDPTTTGYIDADIRVGAKYGYRLAAVAADGTRVGLSPWVRAGVEPPERDIEALELGCDAIVVDTGKGAFCRWSAAEHPGAAGYQLWRLGNTTDARELILRTGLDTTSHADRVGRDVRFAWYAVIAVDADGEIVGRSRATKVSFPADGPPVVDVEPEPAPVVDRAVRVDTRLDLPANRVMRGGLRLVF